MHNEQNTTSQPNRKPHDQFFKATFSNKKVAEAYIRKFLDPELVHHLELDQLTLQQTSYISKQLKPYFSDIVYTCPYGDSHINLTFLFEHKSRPVPYPHVQLLRYILEIWESNIREQTPLHITIPMLFYHGQEKWNYQPMKSYFHAPGPALQKYIPTFDYEFLNISQWPDEKIIALKEAFLVNALLVFKHIWNESYIQTNLNQFFVFLEQHVDSLQGRNFIDRMFV